MPDENRGRDAVWLWWASDLAKARLWPTWRASLMVEYQRRKFTVRVRALMDPDKGES
jgi:hypothetical protein